MTELYKYVVNVQVVLRTGLQVHSSDLFGVCGRRGALHFSLVGQIGFVARDGDGVESNLQGVGRG